MLRMGLCGLGKKLVLAHLFSSDSHYQGPDFHALTNYFYRNQIWSVRCVLGVNN